MAIEILGSPKLVLPKPQIQGDSDKAPKKIEGSFMTFLTLIF
jgi:hypothetical protein